MAARNCLALKLITEAEEGDLQDLERLNRSIKRLESSAITITETHFVQRYRITKCAFEYLCSLLREKSDLRSSQRVSLETKVLSALLFYANGDYQRVIGIANNLSQEAVSMYVQEVTEALNHPNVVKSFIRFPDTAEARDRIKQNFYNKYGFPGVVGCIDGSHFIIVKPHKQEEHLYYSRKHYHSLNVQMISDDQGRILSVNPKFGGATHDAFIWENSRINSLLQTLYSHGEPAWLLGDSGYPQRPWLMTPYSNPLPNTIQHDYNKTHCKARVTIENTFGRLKNRWRCVCKDRTLHYKPLKCAKIIIACSVLHNLAIDFNVPDPQELPFNIQEFHTAVPVEEAMQEDNSSLLTLGRLMRDRIAGQISHNI